MFRGSLELVALLAGAAVMILELTGSRILAPYLGTSIFVWTSLIGIILAALSLGYWLGGRLADRQPEARVLALILLVSGVWCALLSVWASPLLERIAGNLSDLRTASVVVALLLFALPGVLMGMVSPYVVRLKIDAVASSGRTVGTLYAISTIGSIGGTFLAGFVLIAHLSNQAILLLLFATLALCSLLASPRGFLAARGALLAVTALLLVLRPGATEHANVIDVNTLYSRIWVFDKEIEVDGAMRRTRYMRVGNENSGAMFTDFWDLVYDYTRFFELADHFAPHRKRLLMVGGGAYSYPSDLMFRDPDVIIDVVEIDPGVTRMAREYFSLEEDPRLIVHHEDGRVFLNRTDRTYDVVFLDAFKSYYYVPHHLATREAMVAVRRVLAPEGVLCANLLGSIEGPGSEFVRAFHRTVRSVFPQVYLFPVRAPDDGALSQNILLVALTGEAEPPWTNPDAELNGHLTHRWQKPVTEDLPLLRDDFAPVEHYIAKAHSGARISTVLDLIDGALAPTKSPRSGH